MDELAISEYFLAALVTTTPDLLLGSVTFRGESVCFSSNSLCSAVRITLFIMFASLTYVYWDIDPVYPCRTFWTLAASTAGSSSSLVRLVYVLAFLLVCDFFPGEAELVAFFFDAMLLNRLFIQILFKLIDLKCTTTLLCTLNIVVHFNINCCAFQY